VRPFKRSALDLGSEVLLISMKRKCDEAGGQQRCAGHDEAHGHSDMSQTMRFTATRRRDAGYAEIFKLVRKTAGRPSAVGRPAVAKNFSSRSLLSEALKVRRLWSLLSVVRHATQLS
jgi:hypothetical protein